MGRLRKNGRLKEGTHAAMQHTQHTLAATGMNEFASQRLTKYERTQVVGMRSEQLARGAQPFVDVPLPSPGRPWIDVCDIAQRELDAHLLPFIVVRHLPDGKTEQLRIGEPFVPGDQKGAASEAKA